MGIPGLLQHDKPKPWPIWLQGDTGLCYVVPPPVLCGGTVQGKSGSPSLATGKPPSWGIVLWLIVKEPRVALFSPWQPTSVAVAAAAATKPLPAARAAAKPGAVRASVSSLPVHSQRTYSGCNAQLFASSQSDQPALHFDLPTVSGWSKSGQNGYFSGGHQDYNRPAPPAA